MRGVRRPIVLPNGGADPQRRQQKTSQPDVCIDGRHLITLRSIGANDGPVCRPDSKKARTQSNTEWAMRLELPLWWSCVPKVPGKSDFRYVWSAASSQAKSENSRYGL